ncbi:protein MULTIPOLAR SPINDLE 1-like [Pistacia vera]|uniref:protein MULTIPOLAR SPINDLE 1-like n=1 Tax=Pistacia vera TaxID=55513 RepID=UPI001262B84C|nr:protein MULTIPOLAR SPINDLE 1-like [Pistacia vera]
MQMDRNSESLASKDESIKLAVAISLLRSKLRLSQNQSTQPSSESDALRWKRKVKEQKQELIRLREDLREAEDSSHCDLFPQSASFKCCFFDRLGKLSPKISVGSMTFFAADFSDKLLRDS